jgi:hypothetical protein
MQAKPAEASVDLLWRVPKSRASVKLPTGADCILLNAVPQTTTLDWKEWLVCLAIGAGSWPVSFITRAFSRSVMPCGAVVMAIASSFVPSVFAGWEESPSIAGLPWYKAAKGARSYYQRASHSAHAASRTAHRWLHARYPVVQRGPKSTADALDTRSTNTAVSDVRDGGQANTQGRAISTTTPAPGPSSSTAELHSISVHVTPTRV